MGEQQGRKLRGMRDGRAGGMGRSDGGWSRGNRSAAQ